MRDFIKMCREITVADVAEAVFFFVIVVFSAFTLWLLGGIFIV